MGFMKFLSKSLRLRSKKKRPQLERDSFDPPTSREFLDAATEATMTRLLRCSSARNSMGPEEVGLLPDVPAQQLTLSTDSMGVPARRRSASSLPSNHSANSTSNWADAYEARFATPYRAATTGSRPTYTVTIRSRTRTEIPLPPDMLHNVSLDTQEHEHHNANTSTTTTSETHTQNEGRQSRRRSRSLPLSMLSSHTPRRERESRLMHLAQDPSVANLLASGFYGIDGHIDSRAFETPNTSAVSVLVSKSSQEGLQQIRRTGSTMTLKELLGGSTPALYVANDPRFSTQESDLSWAERVIGDQPNTSDEHSHRQSSMSADVDASKANSSHAGLSLQDSDAPDQIVVEESDVVAPLPVATPHQCTKADKTRSISSVQVEVNTSVASPTADQQRTPPASEVFAFLTERRRSHIPRLSVVPTRTDSTSEAPASLFISVGANAPRPAHASSSRPSLDSAQPSQISRSSLDSARPSHKSRPSLDNHFRPSLVGLPAPPSYPTPRPKQKRARSPAHEDEQERPARKVTVTRAEKITMSPAQMQYVQVPSVSFGTSEGPQSPVPSKIPCVVTKSPGPLGTKSPASRSRIPRKASGTPLLLPAEITLVQPTPEVSAADMERDVLLWNRDTNLGISPSVEAADPFTVHKPLRPPNKRTASFGEGLAPPRATPSKRARRAEGTPKKRAQDKENGAAPAFELTPKKKRALAKENGALVATPKKLVFDDQDASLLTASPTAVPPITPVRNHPRMRALLQEQIGAEQAAPSTPPSPASSMDLSPVAQSMMASVREQRTRMREREHRREMQRGRRMASRSGSRA